MPETGQQLWIEQQKTTLEHGLQLEIASLLGEELAAVEEYLLDFTVSGAEAMQELIALVLQNRGKRLRPLLVLLSGSFKKAKRQALHRIAAAVELIHTASLLHDDVIDGACERRSKPSLNALYGNFPAVIAGDYFFARAFELVALCGNVQLIRLFSTAIGAMCEAEIEQARNAFNCDAGEREYLRCAYGKTAALLEACCAAGALLSCLEETAVQQLKAYGRNLGFAFQITDDLLDIWGNPACTGKPAGSDLREGTMTLPLIYILQDPVFGERLRELISRRDFSREKLTFMLDPACRSGPLARAQQKAAAFAGEAVRSLHGLEQNSCRLLLEKIAAFVLQRNS